MVTKSPASNADTCDLGSNSSWKELYASLERSARYAVYALHQNYCKDMNRRDRRLLRVQSQDALQQIPTSRHNQVSLVELGTENIYQEGLFKLVASEIASFPEKQRTAILIDLANRMHFGTQPTPLQNAFLDVGIDLREYQRPLPTDPKERSRQLSLVTYAYKRIASLPCIQQYIAFA